MTSIARTSLRTARCPTTVSYSCFASTSAVASTSKLTLRSNSTLASSTSPEPSTSTASTAPTASTSSDAAASTSTTTVQYSYFVPRVGKTQSSLPVYTDIRNGGTRILTELRNIQGSVSDLQTDLSLFLAETYADPASPSVDTFPTKINKKPLRPKPGRKLLDRTGNPSYLDPVQSGKVTASGKLKIRGNRVEEVKAFLESRGF